MLASELAIFPVKGCAPVYLQAATVEPRGIRGDRQWVIVNATGRFVSQRELPALARLSALLEGSWLRLALDQDELIVETPGPDAPVAPIRVWRDELHLPEAPAAAEWLSRLFGRPLRLFHQPISKVRFTDPDWSRPGDQVSLADGFPLLITTTIALEALNRVATEQVDMRRFRANLVIDGAAEGDEDGWAMLRIGDVILDLVKPCARCTVTTVDQGRGAVSGEEPLATLRRTRMSGDRRLPGVLFGWNAVPRSVGRVRSGDPVEVLARRQAWPIRRISPTR